MFRWWFDLVGDIRFAIRCLSRAKAFCFIAVTSLALGIGAGTALFAVAHAVSLQDVPGVHANGVVELLYSQRGRDRQEWTYPAFTAVREAETPLESAAGFKPRYGSLQLDDDAERVLVNYVSANFLRVLGVRPVVGRDFHASEESGPGNHPVAVLSHRVWRDKFREDPDIVGRTVLLNREPHSVIGVAPEDFRGIRPWGAGTDLWVPITQHPMVTGTDDAMHRPRMAWLLVLGKLRAGANVEEAGAALRTVVASLEPEIAEEERLDARAAKLGPVPALGRSEQNRVLAAFAGVVALVLLVICGNVAGMVLARTADRDREIAVRLALGCGRARLVRHLMAEVLLLAVLGGGFGALYAVWGTRFVTSKIAAGGPEIAFNAPIVAFAIAITLVVALVVGLIPASRFSRWDLISALKDEAGGGSRRVGRIHRIAASAQTGVALVLLVLCAVFLRASTSFDRRDLGFEPHDLLTLRLDLAHGGYESDDEAWPFLDGMIERVSALPGVASVTLADGVPLDQVGNYASVRPTGVADDESEVVSEFVRVTENYFETIGTPILHGRGIRRGDGPSSEQVVVVTAALAEILFPTEDPLGRRIELPLSGMASSSFSIVGVVPDLASSRPGDDRPQVFLPYRQAYSDYMMILARGSTDAANLARPIQTEIRALDASFPIPAAVPAERLVRRATASQRSTSGTTAALGALALFLAAIGVYGVVTFAVAHRTHEIGLRIALGATRRTILRSILTGALRLSLPGLAVGAFAAAAISTALRSMLLGISPLDPIAYLLASAVLVLVVVLASLAPARRAAKTDPVVALRCE